MADFGKINLAALNHKLATFSKKGSNEKIECIVIPIKDNHLYKSDKGNVFVDLVAFKLKEPQKDKDGAVTQTHIIKQSLPKDVRSAMSEDDKKNQPILGGMAIYEGTGGLQEERKAQPDNSIGGDDDEDLPF